MHMWRSSTLTIVGLAVFATSAFAQAPPSEPVPSPAGSAGISAGPVGISGEGVEESMNRAFGVWLDAGRGKWRASADLAASRNNWVFGVAGLRRIEMADRPETLHFLIGAGAIHRKDASETTGALVAGIGMDIPVGRWMGRLQYRFNCSGADGPVAQKFHAGVGWMFGGRR
jgi:hypothetical protein